ncbi:MAG: molybdopterin molybdotransferase MoeA [Chloroflexota bacterium]
MAKQDSLLSVEEARDRILARFHKLEAERIGIEEASGRILAADIQAGFNVPPFANSSMDGFAIVSSDTTRLDSQDGLELHVVDRIAAGSSNRIHIQSGQCARIMTGAPLPDGADAVVPFEIVQDCGSRIKLSEAVPLGSCVRPAGQDLSRGADALKAGAELHGPQIALLAALGQGTVLVSRKPRVTILSTGDELVVPGNPLGPGQIYNSNTPMLNAAVMEAGGEPKQLPSVRDDEEALTEAIGEAMGSDLLLTSGGASVGDFDHVKTVLGAHGELAFWRVRVRPGKPLIFGSIEAMPVIGLPGNPTSAMVTFELFARPAIRAMLGAAVLRPELHAILDEPIDNRGGRRTYARVTLRWLDGAWHASLAGAQDSAMLAPLAHADGVLEVPEDRNALNPGELARVQVWNLPDTLAHG